MLAPLKNSECRHFNCANVLILIYILTSKMEGTLFLHFYEADLIPQLTLASTL